MNRDGREGTSYEDSFGDHSKTEHEAGVGSELAHISYLICQMLSRDDANWKTDRASSQNLSFFSANFSIYRLSFDFNLPDSALLFKFERIRLMLRYSWRCSNEHDPIIRDPLSMLCTEYSFEYYFV